MELDPDEATTGSPSGQEIDHTRESQPVSAVREVTNSLHQLSVAEQFLSVELMGSIGQIPKSLLGHQPFLSLQENAQRSLPTIIERLAPSVREEYLKAGTMFPAPPLALPPAQSQEPSSDPVSSQSGGATPTLSGAPAEALVTSEASPTESSLTSLSSEATLSATEAAELERDIDDSNIISVAPERGDMAQPTTPPAEDPSSPPAIDATDGVSENQVCFQGLIKPHF